jgi:hypothetical protein
VQQPPGRDRQLSLSQKQDWPIPAEQSRSAPIGSSSNLQRPVSAEQHRPRATISTFQEGESIRFANAVQPEQDPPQDTTKLTVPGAFPAEIFAHFPLQCYSPISASFRPDRAILNPSQPTPSEISPHYSNYSPHSPSFSRDSGITTRVPNVPDPHGPLGSSRAADSNLTPPPQIEDKVLEGTGQARSSSFSRLPDRSPPHSEPPRRPLAAADKELIPIQKYDSLQENYVECAAKLKDIRRKFKSLQEDYDQRTADLEEKGQLEGEKDAEISALNQKLRLQHHDTVNFQKVFADMIQHLLQSHDVSRCEKLIDQISRDCEKPDSDNDEQAAMGRLERVLFGTKVILAWLDVLQRSLPGLLDSRSLDQRQFHNTTKAKKQLEQQENTIKTLAAKTQSMQMEISERLEALKRAQALQATRPPSETEAEERRTAGALLSDLRQQKKENSNLRNGLKRLQDKLRTRDAAETVRIHELSQQVKDLQDKLEDRRAAATESTSEHDVDAKDSEKAQLASSQLRQLARKAQAIITSQISLRTALSNLSPNGSGAIGLSRTPINVFWTAQDPYDNLPYSHSLYTMPAGLGCPISGLMLLEYGKERLWKCEWCETDAHGGYGTDCPSWGRERRRGQRGRRA